MRRLVLAALVAAPLTAVITFAVLVEALGRFLEAAEDALSWDAS